MSSRPNSDRKVPPEEYAEGFACALQTKTEIKRNHLCNSSSAQIIVVGFFQKSLPHCLIGLFSLLLVSLFPLIQAKLSKQLLFSLVSAAFTIAV